MYCTYIYISIKWSTFLVQKKYIYIYPIVFHSQIPIILNLLQMILEKTTNGKSTRHGESIRNISHVLGVPGLQIQYINGASNGKIKILYGSIDMILDGVYFPANHS